MPSRASGTEATERCVSGTLPVPEPISEPVPERYTEVLEVALEGTTKTPHYPYQHTHFQLYKPLTTLNIFTSLLTWLTLTK